MNIEKINNLVQNALDENPELFLIDLNVLPENKILVEIDGDNGVNLNECIRVSRAVEHNLDRDEEDFSLEVTTPDISKPLQVKRQYTKNLNRKLIVKLTDNSKIEGTLTNVDDQGISLQWKAREPKPIGKGKVTVEKNKTIPFTDILEAKVKIIF
ncbi:MAG TPA: ribosome assembly cofactor RimP [Flavobacteriaceae bacterium]|nr:ribosome assembly cofactor RimP [Flavobacteriaceae bacterium]